MSPPLHRLLRELVERQGPGVVETAEGLRAALDDFLTEDEATTGELNLLVDAVRLGAVSRLLSMLDQGADPAAAIGETGDAMARDRGTDDATRSRWAVAALGFALGRVGEDAVRPQPPTSAPTPQEPPPPPPAPPRAPTTERAAMPGPTTLGDRAPERATWDHTTPPSTTPPAPSTRSRRLPVIVALVVLVLVAGGIVGWLLYDDEDPTGSARDGEPPSDTAAPSLDPTADVPPELPSNTILISANDGENTRVYRVNADTGEARPLTRGPSDNYPTVSRDRERVVFLARATAKAVRPMVLDLASRQIRPLFGDDGACDYGRRPGFSLAGDKLALVCLTAEGESTGIFVVNPDGTLDTELVLEGGVRGSPTWVSGTEIVYSRGEESGDVRSTLWRVDVETGEERQLTDGTDGWDTQPVWCEATSTLLFVRSDSLAQQGELWTITERGFEERLPIDEPVGGPVWSPGCGHLAFTVEGEDGPMLVTAPSENPADYTPVDEIPGKITVPVWDTR